MNSETFCVNPWVTLHANMSKGFNPCCVFKNVYKHDSVAEYIHSEELQSVKRRMLNGEKISECSNCWKLEQAGHVSKRQRDNKTYNNIFRLLNRNPSEPHGNYVEYYLRLGNHCNLRCTSCNDSCSSGWISENKKFNIKTKSVDTLPGNSNVWQHLKAHASTIKAIEFIGGEPFMINTAEQVDLLEWLVTNGHSKHIRIKYNTNGTVVPVEQIKFWSKFNAVEINVSMDGTKDKFEYLRFPAQWNTVDSTVKYFQELQKSIPQLELSIITTVSILTIGYMQEVLDYCKAADLNIIINMLEHPAILNLYNFEHDVKLWIAERIQHVDHQEIANISDNLNCGASNISGKMLLDFLAPLDQRRNLNVRDTFPELVECLDNKNDQH